MSASLMNSNLSLDKIYPIGSIYMNINSTNPTDLFGGIWEQIKERFMLGCGDSHSAGSTGGEFNHTLTVDEMPNHEHVQAGQTSDGMTNPVINVAQSGEYSGAYMQYNWQGGNAHLRINTYPAGGNSPHNITPPPLPCGLYLAKNSITTLRGWYHE